MFDRQTLNELFDYTTFTWETYARTARSLPPDALARPVEGSGWPALRDVLFHVAAAWDGWLRDRLGLHDPLDASPERVTAWSDLDVHRQRTRGWLRRIIDETADGGLHDATQPMFEGTPAEMRVSAAEILAHILLHERGHHGDITTLLARLGATPPSIDYLTYVFFKQRKAGS